MLEREEKRKLESRSQEIQAEAGRAPSSERSAVESVPLKEREIGSSIWRGMAMVFNVVGGLLDEPRLIRLVGPNQRPEERHEFEDPSRQAFRRIGRGL